MTVKALLPGSVKYSYVCAHHAISYFHQNDRQNSQNKKNAEHCLIMWLVADNTKSKGRSVEIWGFLIKELVVW